jgi:glycosyltransferase involved in cell wall biosynthesis
VIVGKIWDCEYPWDVRVEKVTDALLAAGHEVHLMCRNRTGLALHERIGALEIHRMPNWPRAGTWFDRASSFPAFMNPRWIRHVLRVSREAKVDLLLCRDLPLAPLALWVGRRLGVPVVVDVAENYPAMLKHRFHWREFKPHNLIVRNPVLATAVERYVMPRADGVMAVVEESRDRLIEVGAPADRVVVVCNTPTAARIEMMGAIARERGARSGAMRLVYLGLLGVSRGIDVTLRAVQELDRRGVEVHFDVIGGMGTVDYRAEAQALGIAHRVTFHGHVPYDDALRLVAAADVGIVPHHATEHWRTTIPNKLFDYMAAELPVLVSDAPPTKRIVEATGCGLAFRDRDPLDLAACITQLLDPATRQRMGAAGRRAALEQYNWEHDARRLVDQLERVVGTRRGERVSAPRARPAAPESRSANRAADTNATAR